jgi:hypothetical protein
MIIFGHIFFPLRRTNFLKKAEKKVPFLGKNHIFFIFFSLYGAQNGSIFLRILAHKMNYGD